MKIRTLKKLLHKICYEGYSDWTPWFCDEEEDIYTVNHIYVDDDGDVCLESTDMEGDNNYDFTTADILHRLKKYDPNGIVYFLEEFDNGDTCVFDISNIWYIDFDDDGNERLYIDCFSLEN
jgi:hypothetical protein